MLAAMKNMDINMTLPSLYPAGLHCLLSSDNTATIRTEDEVSKVLWDVGILPQHYNVSQSRGLRRKFLLPWKPHTSQTVVHLTWLLHR